MPIRVSHRSFYAHHAGVDSEASPGMKAESRIDQREWTTPEVEMSMAFLFLVQGLQLPGMFHALPDHSAVTRTLDEVSEYLNSDIRELASEEALRSSVSVQL